MQNYRNASPFDTHRTVQKDGRTFLVVKSVPIVEGVLNKFLVPMDEFGSFTKDWDGVPIVLRHPKQNNGSARVPNPDVPVIGSFFGAFLDSDNRRLLGEYWFDEAAMLATNEGKDIYDAILAGKVIETSTGYYANIEDTPGVHKGLYYIGIQRNIHPDHIAVLPDEVGACSIRDGCGINRNSAAFQNGESCPCKIEDGDSEETASKKAWGACKRAGWKKDKDDQWVKKNYAIFENASAETPDYTDSSMVAFMLPDEVKEKIKAAFPFIEDDVYNNLHLTLAFLGDTETTDTIKALKAMFEASDYFPTIKGSIQGLARFISGGEQDAFVLTFDSPDMPKLHTRLSNALEWKGVNTPKDHGFIPHITIAYIGAEDEIPADTFDPIEMTIDHIALVNGNKTFLTVPLWQGDHMGGTAQNRSYSIASPKPGNWLVTLLSKFNKENKPMDKFKELVQKILNEAGWKVVFNDANQTASATPNSPTASPTLIGLESVVNEMGGVDKFAEVIKNMANLPAQIQALSEQMNGISGSVEAAKTLAQNAAQAAESEKKDIVGRLIANGSCPLPESVLNTLALDDLKKLETSYQPTNYAALGGFVTNTNPGGGNELPLGLPSYFAAKVN